MARSKVYNKVFGGYTKLPWKSDDSYESDSEAFLFSVSHQTVYTKKAGDYSTHHHSSFGPTFQDLKFMNTDGRNFDRVGNYFGDPGRIDIKAGDLCCKPYTSD